MNFLFKNKYRNIDQHKKIISKNIDHDLVPEQTTEKIKIQALKPSNIDRRKKTPEDITFDTLGGSRDP